MFEGRQVGFGAFAQGDDDHGGGVAGSEGLISVLISDWVMVGPRGLTWLSVELHIVESQESLV
jgi:hypothetical protein